MNKYGSVRTWSNLCQREFASKKECLRAEELALLEKAGEIYNLEFQPKYVLCFKPKITYAADFRYRDYTKPHNNVLVVEDVKGILLRETRVNIHALYAKRLYGVIPRCVILAPINL